MSLPVPSGRNGGHPAVSVVRVDTDRYPDRDHREAGVNQNPAAEAEITCLLNVKVFQQWTNLPDRRFVFFQ